jgi:hypothetical protein
MAEGPSPIPLARLISGDMLFEWHDAVAVVQQLIEHLIPDLSQVEDGIPGPDRIWLDAGGGLRAQLEKDGVAGGMLGLGRLLSQLLTDRNPPPGLRLVVMQAASNAATMSLVEFTSELGRWERPNRQQKLITLYERARQRDANLKGTEPAHAPVPPQVPPALEKPQPENAVRKLPLRLPVPRIVFVAAVSAGLAAVVALLLIRNGGTGGGTEEIASVEPEPVVEVEPAAPAVTADRLLTPQPLIDPATIKRGAPIRGDILLPARSLARGASPRLPAADSGSALRAASPAFRRAEDEFRRAQALYDGRQYARAVDAFSRVLELLKGEESTDASDLRWTVTEFANLSRAFVTQSEAAASRIYTNRDQGVIEPVARGPFLPPPPPPGMPESDMAVLDVLIDARGVVESAHLASPRNQFRARWFVAAAKAWRFQPATKDGQPVKYLKRVFIAESDPSIPQ